MDERKYDDVDSAPVILLMRNTAYYDLSCVHEHRLFDRLEQEKAGNTMMRYLQERVRFAFWLYSLSDDQLRYHLRRWTMDPVDWLQEEVQRAGGDYEVPPPPPFAGEVFPPRMYQVS